MDDTQDTMIMAQRPLGKIAISILEEPGTEPGLVDRLVVLIKNMAEEKQKRLLIQLESGLLEEKRKHERKPYPVSVKCSARDRIKNGLIRDISAGGILLETDESREPLSAGEELLLTIPHPNQERLIRIRGEVVRVEPQKIAVAFKKDANHSRAL